MITIETLVEQGANVKLEITPSDLKMFAESIVQRTSDLAYIFLLDRKSVV